jgi:hypothetical protein
MANWDKKYFVTELVNTNMLDAPWNPRFTEKEGTVIALDSRSVKRLPYGDDLFWPGKWRQLKVMRYH